MSDSLREILAEFDKETEDRIKESNRTLAREQSDAKRLRKVLGLPTNDPLALAKIGNLVKQHGGNIKVMVEIPDERPFSLSSVTLLNASLNAEALEAEKIRSAAYKELLAKYESK